MEVLDKDLETSVLWLLRRRVDPVCCGFGGSLSKLIPGFHTINRACVCLCCCFHYRLRQQRSRDSFIPPTLFTPAHASAIDIKSVLFDK